MTSAKATAANDIRELKSRMMLNRPNLQKMVGYSTSVKKELCSTNYFTQGFYEFPKSDLSKENSARVQSGLPYSEQELSNITSQALNGLNSLHQQKITHGDIRPQYLGYNKESGDLQILDRLADPSPVEKTQASHIVSGKVPLYMSPELYKKLQGKDKVVKYDPFKNDLYALALSVLESGNGRPIKEIYNSNGTIDQAKLDGQLNEFSSKYRGDYLNNFLRSNLAKDEASRPTSTELVSRLGSYSSHSAYATPGQWNQTESQSWSTGQEKNAFGSSQGVNTFGNTGTSTTTTTTSTQAINTAPTTTTYTQYGTEQVVNQANLSGPSFLKNDTSNQFYVENDQVTGSFKKPVETVKVNEQSTTLNTTQTNVSVQPTTQTIITTQTVGPAQNVENVALTKTATLSQPTQNLNLSQQSQVVQPAKTTTTTVNYSQAPQTTVSYVQQAQPAQSTVSYIQQAQPAQSTVTYVQQSQPTVSYAPAQSTVTYVQQNQTPVSYLTTPTQAQTFSFAPQASTKSITYVDAQPQTIHYVEQAPQQTVTYIQSHPESYSYSSQPVTYIQSQPQTVTYVQSSPQFYDAPVHIEQSPVTYISSQPSPVQYIRQEQTVTSPIQIIDSGAKHTTSYVQSGDAKKSVIFSNAVIPQSTPVGFSSQRNVVSYVQNEAPVQAQAQVDAWVTKSEKVIPLMKEFSNDGQWGSFAEATKQNTNERKSVSFINHNETNGSAVKYIQEHKTEVPSFSYSQVNTVTQSGSSQIPKSITYEEFLNLQKKDPSVTIKETHPETPFDKSTKETHTTQYLNPIVVTSTQTTTSGPTTTFTNYTDNKSHTVHATPSYEKTSETTYTSYANPQVTVTQEQHQGFQDAHHYGNYQQSNDEYQYSGHQANDDHNYAQSQDAHTWTTSYKQAPTESQVTQGFSTVKSNGSDNIKVKRYRIENGNKVEITGSSYIA